MAHSILFVDDDSNILSGLKRSLRHLQEEWDMTFCTSGPEAIATLEGKEYEVVVSDMRMPQMNGVELLNTILQRWPGTIRFILSGHADRELILRAVGSTHQYLSKPCPADHLASVVRRALNLKDYLNQPELRRVVTQIDQLPTLPSLYTEILRCLENETAEIADVAEIVSRDIGMTAKILQLVNSAFFGLGRPISHIAEAVSYLGLELIKGLVLTIHCFRQFEGGGTSGKTYQYLWQHSFAVAEAAREIARQSGKDAQLRETAYVGGMLHDTGKLILEARFPRECASVARIVKQRNIPDTEAEKEVLSVTHAELGAYLLGIWGLPMHLVETVAFHHQPSLAHLPGNSADLLVTVHVADVFVHETETHPASLRPRLDLPFLQETGVLSQVEGWRQSFQTGTRS